MLQEFFTRAEIKAVTPIYMRQIQVCLVDHAKLGVSSVNTHHTSHCFRKAKCKKEQGKLSSTTIFWSFGV